MKYLGPERCVWRTVWRDGRGWGLYAGWAAGALGRLKGEEPAEGGSSKQIAPHNLYGQMPACWIVIQ